MESQKENKRKLNKKNISILCVAILLIIVAIIAVIFTVKYFRNKPKEVALDENTEPSILLPDTTYSDMPVKDINMTFLKDNNETMISMVIDNTTQTHIQNESLNAILLDEKGEVLSKMSTYINDLPVGESYSISVIQKGDLTATKSIQLQK